jgi:glucokinase
MGDKQNIGIGLDLGGTSLKYALCTIDGDIITQGKRPSYAQDNPEKILKNMVEAIIEMKVYAERSGLTPRVVGLGSPGSIDIDRGFLHGSTPNFRFWKNVAIAEELKQRIKLPVFVDNDANMMAFGEFRFGAGRKYRNIICLTIGTGIGGGIFINGQLYRGAACAGSELGHSTVVIDGIACNCGGNGCLEQYASATAIVRQYEAYARDSQIKLNDRHKDVQFLFELYREKDTHARRAIDEAIYYLGRGVASFINIFNPEIIIIGGGVAESGSFYIDKVRQIASKFAMESSLKDVKLVAASLGNTAGYLGAVAYAFERLINTGLNTK